MSRDNAEDDAVEIDLGSIGRRIGGLFGSKGGKDEKPSEGPGQQEKDRQKGAGNSGEKVDTQERPGEEVSQKDAEEQAAPEKKVGRSEPEEDYFEIDFGKLFGRKKPEEKPVASESKEKELMEGRKDGPEKSEDASEQRAIEEKKESSSEEKQKDDGSIEIDFGRLFGKGKKRPKETAEPVLPVTEPEKSPGTEEDGSIEIDFGKLFGKRKGQSQGEHKKTPAQQSKQDVQSQPKEAVAQAHEKGHVKSGEKTETSDTVEIDIGKLGASLSGLFGSASKEELKKERREDKQEEDYLRTAELDIDAIGKSVIHHRKMVVFVLLAAIVSFSLYVRLLSADSPLSPDYDTYLHYRYARDVISNNMELPGWDETSYYPPGRGRAVPGGYPLMEAYLYKFLQMVYPDITLINAAMVLTALFGGLATIPAFFIGRDASGELGGLFSAFLVGTLPAILVRSVGSYADTDAMVLFFSLLIVALYMKAVEAAKEKFELKLFAYSLLAAFATIILIYTWGATFEYILQLLVPLPFLLFGIYVLSGSGNLSRRVRAGLSRTKYVFLAALILFVVPFFVYGVLNFDDGGHYTIRPLSWGVRSVEGIVVATAQKFLNPLSVSELKSESGGVGGTGRNVYISVAEMQPPVLENYTSQFGTVIYLALAFFIAGASLLLYRFVSDKRYGELTFGLFLALISAGILITRVDIMTPEMRSFLAKFFVVFGSLFFMAGIMRKSDVLGKLSGVFFESNMQERALLIVLVWGGGLFFVSTLGIRFLMLLGPPLCIAAGVLLDRLIKSSSVIYKRFNFAVLGIVAVVLVALFAPSAYSIGSSAKGSMDPQWHDMLIWVKLNSAPDATVTTWWDPGHWVTAIAQRRSGADGAHYPGGPRPISMRIRDFGWSFTTTNESESVDTLRNYLGNASEMYYISSNDLIGKFVWLSYFSTGTKQQYIILGESGSYPQNGATLHVYQMSQNVAIVVKESGDELEPWLYVNDNRVKIKEMVYFDQNGRTVRQSSKEGEDALVWMQGDRKLIVYMPGSVKDNILTRTYFFGGEGLEKFKLEFANPQIKLYQVKF